MISKALIAQALISLYGAINVIAFGVMFGDKIKSKKKRAQRISEGMMFFLASAFGAIGVYAGMFVFRHKTRKWYFIVGIPLLILQNIAFLYAIVVFYRIFLG